jgi:hypothetical protein
MVLMEWSWTLIYKLCLVKKGKSRKNVYSCLLLYALGTHLIKRALHARIRVISTICYSSQQTCFYSRNSLAVDIIHSKPWGRQLYLTIQLILTFVCLFYHRSMSFTTLGSYVFSE